MQNSSSSRLLRKRILIVDDHPVVLFGLRLLFQNDDGYVVVGESVDIASARAQTQCLRPDYIILDLQLGGKGGVSLIHDLLAIHPGARVLVYSSHEEQVYAPRALRAGARGYVSKSEGLPIVAQALRTLATGHPYVGEKLRDCLSRDVAHDPEATVSGISSLSEREHQVMRLIGQGASSREIADALALSIKTVGTYRERIKVKLDLDSGRALEWFARSDQGV